MDPKIQEAIDEFRERSVDLGKLAEEYLVSENITTVVDLEEAYVDITGDPLGDLDVIDMINEILFKEEYARFS